MPAQAGIHWVKSSGFRHFKRHAGAGRHPLGYILWIPAFAGMTKDGL
jgi:hypothetical protein